MTDVTDNKPPKKKGGKKTADQYIEHEEVKTEEQPKVQTETVEAEAEEISPEKQAKLEVAKLNLADAAIAELRVQYGGLTIAGPEDKAGYKAVKAAWQEVRSVRTGLEKRALAIRNKFKMITTAISKEEDRLIDQLTPLEEELQGKYKAIDDAKEKAEKEKQEQEQQQLMARLQELVGLGMKLIDGFYRMGDTISMDVATLRALPEEQYQNLVKTVKAKADELAELERQRKEAQDKEDKRLKDEQDKLRKEQEDLQREKNQMRAERRENRVGKLEGLGFQLSTAGGPENMFFRKVAFNVDKIVEMTAAEFTEFVQEMTTKVKGIKDEEAKQEEKERVTSERLAQIRALGFINRGEDFHFDNGFKTITHGRASLMELDDYGFSEHFKVLKESVEEANQGKLDHQEGQRKEAEALEAKKKFISATMERAGLSFSYQAQEFYWEYRNKTIKLGWNDLLPLTEPQISDKAASLVVDIDLAKKFTKNQDTEQAKNEEKEKQLAMGDKERWTTLTAKLESLIEEINPETYKTKSFQVKARKLRDNLLNLNQ